MTTLAVKSTLNIHIGDVMNKVLALIALLSTGAASADEISSAKIERVRAYTSFQQPNTRNFTIFTIDKPLLGGCSALYISQVDKEALSILLMAKAQNSKVLVGYQETLKSPWDTTICPALHVEVM